LPPRYNGAMNPFSKLRLLFDGLSPRWEKALWVLVALAVAGLSGWAAWRPLFLADATAFDYPLGPDPGLWGKAAVLARFGAPQTLPPAFPVLASVLAGGDSLVQGGLRVNALSLGFASLLSGAGAAMLSTGKWAAMSAAVAASAATALTLHIFPSVYFMQPDMLALGAITAVGAGAAALARFGNGWSALGFGIASGVCFSAREHGIVILASALVALAVTLRRGRRLRLGLVFLLGLQLGGATAAGAPHMPFFWTHGSFNGTITKAEVAIRDSMLLARGGSDPKALSGDLRKVQSKNAAYLQSMRSQALSKGDDFLPLFSLAGLGVLVLGWLRGWRSAVLISAALSPLAASLVFWTQWRHFFVLSGLGTMIVAGAAGALSGRFLPRLGPLAMLGAAAAYTFAWTPYQTRVGDIELRRLLKEQSNHSAAIEVAKTLREDVEPGSLVMATDTIAILAGMQPIALKNREILGQGLPDWPSFLFRTYIVDKRAPGPLWERVQVSGSWGIFRLLRPSGISQACLYGEWTGPVVERIPEDVERLRPNPAEGCTAQ
jgi:hypothetical protein